MNNINYLRYKLIKQASTPATIARAIPATIVANSIMPGVGDAANSIGSLAGSFGSSKDIDKLIEADEAYGLDFVPGRAAYKLSQQRRAIENKLRKKKKGNKTLSERLGIATSALLPALAGMGIGALANKKDRAQGALIGAILGGTVGTAANIGGALATNLTKGRDESDLEEYYNSDTASAANYLIPGVASYNTWKNLMATDRLLSKARNN